MKKRILYGLLLVVLAANLGVGLQIYLRSAAADDKNDPYANYALLAKVMEIIRSDYVDADKVSYQDLMRGALRGMISTLDPHSEYMEPRKFDEMRKDTEGVFGGVGIVVVQKDNFLTVVAPMEDTPSFRAGILTGDRIIKIDGKSTEKFSLDDAVKKLRGEPGTEVTITILRPANEQIRDITLTRAKIAVYSAKDLNGKREFTVGENGVGYVRLLQFGEQTSAELEEALKKLEAQNLQSLVLDLRGNPGGLLDQAVKVCEKFLQKNDLVVTTEGRSPQKKEIYRATGRTSHPNYPLVILVNGGSASASEIVAGCLQDSKRAIVLGEQTFGKGSVQSILPLDGGGALRLTTAKYYTPSHKVIHEKGITPDVMVAMTEEDERSVAAKRSAGGGEALDDKERERIRNVRDVQYDRAVDLLKGISLFTNRIKPESKLATKQ